MLKRGSKFKSIKTDKRSKKSKGKWTEWSSKNLSYTSSDGTTQTLSYKYRYKGKKLEVQATWKEEPHRIYIIYHGKDAFDLEEFLKFAERKLRKIILED